MAEKPITTAPYSTGVSGDYYIFVNDNGVLRQVDIEIISKHLGNVTWATLTGKPFNNVDGDEFTILGETLKINICFLKKYQKTIIHITMWRYLITLRLMKMVRLCMTVT